MLRNDVTGKPVAEIPTYRVEIDDVEAIHYAEEDKEKTMALVVYTETLTPTSPLIAKYAELTGEDLSKKQKQVGFKRTDEEGWKIMK